MQTSTDKATHSKKPLNVKECHTAEMNEVEKGECWQSLRIYAYACGQFSCQRCKVDISKVEDHERIRSLELKLFARPCGAAFPQIVAVNGENELFNLKKKMNRICLNIRPRSPFVLKLSRYNCIHAYRLFMPSIALRHLYWLNDSLKITFCTRHERAGRCLPWHPYPSYLEDKDAILLGNDDDHVFGRGNFESVERFGDDNPAFVYEGGVGGFDDSYQSSVEIRRLKLLQPSFLVMVAEPRSIRGCDRSRFLVFFLRRWFCLWKDGAKK